MKGGCVSAAAWTHLWGGGGGNGEGREGRESEMKTVLKVCVGGPTLGGDPEELT